MRPGSAGELMGPSNQSANGTAQLACALAGCFTVIVTFNQPKEVNIYRPYFRNQKNEAQTVDFSKAVAD